ncbi:DUF4332 domain-containing protein [Aureispira]|nr:DUF4332 domain-containing protein [Aureispira sp.]
MNTHIIDIEGIGSVYTDKLVAAGINTIEQLLNQGATKSGRNALEKETGIDGKRILDWIGMADLYRINGIGKQFAELLKATGVDTVKELRTRNPENLHTKLEETNEDKNLTKAVPSFVQVKDWVLQSKSMDTIIRY